MTGHVGVLVRVFRQVGGERERVKQVLQRRGRKTFFPYLLSVMEEEDTQCRSKRHRFGFFFL
jgi:hypothetical protein